MEKFITQYDFADMMSVHVNTVRKWIKEGMPHIKVANVIRINAKASLEWVQEKGKSDEK